MSDITPPTFRQWLSSTGRDPGSLTTAQKTRLIAEYYAARGTLPDKPPPFPSYWKAVGQVWTDNAVTRWVGDTWRKGTFIVKIGIGMGVLVGVVSLYRFLRGKR